MIKEITIMPNTAEYPFSSAVKAGNLVFVSGNGGHVGKDGEKVLGIKAQTRQCFENIKQVLEAAGSSLWDVVKTTVFITDINDFDPMNEIYKSYFTKDRPARSTVVCGLVNPDMLIEVECVAYKP